MIYRVFATQGDLDAANAAWAAARKADGVYDICQGQSIDPSVTCAWDNGRTLEDGRIACTVPPQWADAFGGSEENFPIEGELTEEDLPHE